jgi:hypothetical protein
MNGLTEHCFWFYTERRKGCAFIRNQIIKSMLLLDMKLEAIILCLFLCDCPCVLAQDQYSLPACTSPSTSGKVVGGRIKLRLPKGAIVKKGQDVDYSNYAVGFGAKRVASGCKESTAPWPRAGKFPGIGCRLPSKLHEGRGNSPTSKALTRRANWRTGIIGVISVSTVNALATTTYQPRQQLTSIAS